VFPAEFWLLPEFVLVQFAIAPTNARQPIQAAIEGKVVTVLRMSPAPCERSGQLKSGWPGSYQHCPPSTSQPVRQTLCR
jgi:hypothetical protein